MTRAIPAIDPVSAADFVDALSRAANGVALLSARGESGPAGLTVSSLCSVCAEPPLMLACVMHDNYFCTASRESGFFAFNFLNDQQREIALVFAGLGKSDEVDRFNHGEWCDSAHGSPLLDQALITLDCRLVKAERQGTHVIHIGEVLAVGGNPHAKPLLYSGRRFAHLGESLD